MRCYSMKLSRKKALDADISDEDSCVAGAKLCVPIYLEMSCFVGTQWFVYAHYGTAHLILEVLAFKTK